VQLEHTAWKSVQIAGVKLRRFSERFTYRVACPERAEAILPAAAAARIADRSSHRSCSPVARRFANII
jgi:hypothetical protein